MQTTKQFTSFFSLIMVIIWLAGCASTGGNTQRPAWIDGESAQFPRDFYLLGVGQGSTLDRASNAARSDLGKSIKVSISSNLTTRLEVEQRKNKSGSSENISATTDRQIQTRSQVKLQGINIEKSWQDPVSKEYFSLATLDRKIAEKYLTDDINKHNRQIMSLIDTAANSQDAFHGLGLLLKAKKHAAARSELNEYLRVVNRSGRGISSSLGTRDIEQQLQKLQRSIKISVRSTGTESDKLTEYASGALGEAGFLAGTGESADFVLKVSLKDNQPFTKDGWIWIRALLSVSLVATSDGSVKGSHEWKIKQSANDEESAKSRLTNKSGKLLNTELIDTLISFANH